MRRNLLVTLADRNYIDQAKQLFSSVYFNAGWMGDYMLLAHEVPESELRWFRDKGIIVKECRSLLEKKVAYEIESIKYPPTLLSKFYLFTPEFRRWKNVVFLEADIIVRASLEGLTNISGIGGVEISPPNILISRLNNPDSTETNAFLDGYSDEGFDWEKPIFNAGVIAFSTDIIEDDTFIKMREFLKLHRKYITIFEETIINLFNNKKWVKLPMIYNANVNYLSKRHGIKNERVAGAVLHFSSFGKKDDEEKDKPWHETSHFYKEWKHNLEKSESIDLARARPPAKKWSRTDIILYSIYIKSRIAYLKQRCFDNDDKIGCVHGKFIDIKNMPDRFLGLVGILLKGCSPRLYSKLIGLKARFGFR